MISRPSIGLPGESAAEIDRGFGHYRSEAYEDCERMNKEERMKAAFQGERGAYSEVACYDFFGHEVDTLPLSGLENVFQAVSDGSAEMGVVPIENTYAGTVTKTYDLLMTHNLFIVGETYQRIVHCLLANPGARLDQIRRVYSHPQALEQCDAFLSSLGAEGIPTRDTAGAARQIKEVGFSRGRGDCP